jgi:hypothetical protein
MTPHALVRVAERLLVDFISLTDMVKSFEGGGALIEQWLKNKDTVLFLGVWEQINNSSFNSLEFEGIKNEAGRNSFYLSAKKWIDATGAIGLLAKAGRYGGTYAHRDIAFEFGSWLSPEFKLYLIKEFQRLKDNEARATSIEWNFQRMLAKVNYRIHTDAIKERLIPPQLSKAQTSIVYASEADLLNVALFGMTAAQGRQASSADALPDRRQYHQEVGQRIWPLGNEHATRHWRLLATASAQSAISSRATVTSSLERNSRAIDSRISFPRLSTTAVASTFVMLKNSPLKGTSR